MSTNNPQQSPSDAGKTCRCACKASVIIRIFIFVVLAVAVVLFLYLMYTDSGQVILGNIANKGFSNWLMGEGNSQVEEEAAAALEKNGVNVVREVQVGVSSLNFGGCPKPSDETLKNIAKLYRLGTLHLGNVEISDDQLMYLSKLNHLTSLVLSGTPVTDAGLAHLTGLQSLQTLHISHTGITDAGLEQIAKLPGLLVLDVSSTKITDKGMKEIAKLNNINWLLIGGNKLTDKGIAELASISELKHITLSSDIKISPEVIQELKRKIPKLFVDNANLESPDEKPAAATAPAAEGEKQNNEAKP
jgi:Leucine-rich repeat (LRR) protein